MINYAYQSPEQVLVIPKEEFDKRNPFEGFAMAGPERTDLAEYLQGNPGKIAFFKERELVEKDESLLQIIPYITFLCEESVFTYRRAGSEGRLSGQVSIGIGGHVNSEDDPDSPFLAFLRGAAREIEEEVGVKMPLEAIKDRVVGLIYDPSTPVGRVHLGVSIVVKVVKETGERMINDAAKDLHAPSWQPLKDFSATFATESIETWSSLVLREILRSQSTDGKWTKPDFRERAGMLAITAANLASAASGMSIQDAAMGYEAARDQVEQAAGQVQAMLAGAVQNADIREERVKQAGKEFLAELPSILRHQAFNK